MSEIIYKYYVPNMKYLNLLNDYLLNIPNLPTNFGLTSEDEIVNIIYYSELSSDDKNLLDLSMSQYIPEQSFKLILQTTTLNIIKNQIQSTNYSTVSMEILNIDLLKQILSPNVVIDSIMLVTFLTGPENSISELQPFYQIKVYDSINNIVLIESEQLNNTNPNFIKLEFNNMISSINNSLLEIQLKVSSNNYNANILSAQLIYNSLYS